MKEILTLPEQCNENSQFDLVVNDMKNTSLSNSIFFFKLEQYVYEYRLRNQPLVTNESQHRVYLIFIKHKSNVLEIKFKITYFFQ